MCQWLIDHAQEERVSAVVDKDLLCTLEGKTHEHMLMLMQWVLQLLATQALPSEFSDPEVCALGLSMRAEEVGPRLATLVQIGAFAHEGEIDWSGAAYRPLWEDNYVVALHHPTTGKEVRLPGHVYICNAYELVDNHLDHMARCTLQGSTHTLGDYFTGQDAVNIGKEFWVNAGKTFKRLGEHAKTAKAQLSAPAPARGPAEKARAICEVQAVVADAHTKRKAVATEAGRQKLVEREEEKKRMKKSILAGNERSPLVAQLAPYDPLSGIASEGTSSIASKPLVPSAEGTTPAAAGPSSGVELFGMPSVLEETEDALGGLGSMGAR